jgi:hypothetical protein
MFAAITIFVLILSPVLLPATISVFHAAGNYARKKRSTPARVLPQPSVASI